MRPATATSTSGAVCSCSSWRTAAPQAAQRPACGRPRVAKCLAQQPTCSSSQHDGRHASLTRTSGSAWGRLAAVGAFSAMLVSTLPVAAETLTLADVTPSVAPSAELLQREQAIIDIFERNTLSVVNIFDITLQVGQPAGGPGSVEAPEGNGTGFMWDSDGYVVTNYHVLGNVLKGLGSQAKAGAKVARVAVLGATLAPRQLPPCHRQPLVGRLPVPAARRAGPDGMSQSFEGFLVGYDRSKDLAVIKVNVPQALSRPMTLGDSDALRIGQQVLAIGNPFGFDHTLTTGVISGLGRAIQSRAGVLIGGGLQTDAAINPGNSGGPLIDAKGRVIGVNTAIFTPTGTSAGIGFAIPVNTVKRVVPQLITYGKVVQPSLGVQVAQENIARALQVKKGAMVQAVEPNSAAAKAGLLPTRRSLGGIVPGDVITAFGSVPISNAGDLQGQLDRASVGDAVKLKVLRNAGQKDEKEVELQLVLQESRA